MDHIQNNNEEQVPGMKFIWFKMRFPSFRGRNLINIPLYSPFREFTDEHSA